jgi:nucleotide-binding universal stress UspA family protein
MFATILVPVDGSTRAEKILPYVEDLASTCRSKVIFLQVLEPATFMVSTHGSTPYYNQEMADAACYELQQYLAGLVNQFRASGIEASLLIRFGLVVNTILEVADEVKADLIAMASHGRTGLPRVFYGSVAAGILNQSVRPLLLIRSVEPLGEPER